MVPSWTQLIQGLFTEKYNLVHFLNPIPIWLRYNQKIPVKIMSWAHLNGSAIVVGNHISAHSFTDLAGKQIAIPYWYSMHNILLQNEVNLRVVTPSLNGLGFTSTEYRCLYCR
ncbi:twin-arginine translocation pathway signal [Thioploca ingrica]|uniref:Twin-arginine translocation pathway signal n=1 Tax=Thioploca ingrica TaxID=40754 RepID=A0A090AIL7_9GAMM|nr:twin-arginine translocation pathway signal [Thioploca ingrica]